jgi:hypothetical protein
MPLGHSRSGWRRRRGFGLEQFHAVKGGACCRSSDGRLTVQSPDELAQLALARRPKLVDLTALDLGVISGLLRERGGHEGSTPRAAAAPGQTNASPRPGAFWGLGDDQLRAARRVERQAAQEVGSSRPEKVAPLAARSDFEWARFQLCRSRVWTMVLLTVRARIPYSTGEVSRRSSAASSGEGEDVGGPNNRGDAGPCPRHMPEQAHQV